MYKLGDKINFKYSDPVSDEAGIIFDDFDVGPSEDVGMLSIQEPVYEVQIEGNTTVEVTPDGEIVAQYGTK